MIVTVVIERAKHEHAKTNSLPRRDFSFLGKKKDFTQRNIFIIISNTFKHAHFKIFK